MINKKSWFHFKGFFSYDYGILAEKQPDIVKPARKVNRQEIPGRNGAIYIDENAFEAYTKTVECAIFDIKRLDEINLWLDGYGDLIFSNERDKVYKARVLNQIPFSKTGTYFDRKRFPVVFEVQPIKHSVDRFTHTLDIDSSYSVFYGKGTVPSKPIITVYGNGSINLFVNDTEIFLKDVDHHITINSEIMDAYKGNENQNMKMSGSFPLLSVDKNIIKYTGNAERIEIIPNWGWL